MRESVPAETSDPAVSNADSGSGRLLRRLLTAQLATGVVVSIVGTLVARLFVASPPGQIVILAVLSALVFAADIMVATTAMRRGLRRNDHDRTEIRQEICARWHAIADLPFAPLRRLGLYPLMALLLAAWTLALVRLQHLPRISFLLLYPGSVLVWLYWLALRFLITEQLVRKSLSHISITSPECEYGVGTRVTLAQRMMIAVPGITVFAGTLVAGVVGDHTATTVTVGAGASVLVALGVVGLLAFLLTNSVTQPIEALRTAVREVGIGRLDVIVPVVSTDEIGTLAASFNHMIAGLRERDRIRGVLGTYVDQAVAQHILDDGDELTEGNELEVTALFLDVRGFTTYSEKRSAREVVAMLNRLFAVVVPVIHAHRGYVDKFIGDGLMAVFGAPLADPDHAAQALSAALAITDAVRSRPAGDPAIGIGLNSGIVVAGNIGATGRLNFSVIGDAVNVAARIEAATRLTGDEVLLSEHTRSLLPDALRRDLEERQPIQLKGKSASTRLYTPTSRRADTG